MNVCVTRSLVNKYVAPSHGIRYRTLLFACCCGADSQKNPPPLPPLLDRPGGVFAQSVTLSVAELDPKN